MQAPLTNIIALSNHLKKNITLVDLETTSLLNKDPSIFSIIEIALIEVSPQGVVRKSSLIDPGIKLNYKCKEITGIEDHMLKGKPKFEKFAQYIDRMLKNHVVIGFNSKTFDVKALVQETARFNYVTDEKSIAQLDVRDFYLYDKKKKNIYDKKGTLLLACQEHGIQLSGNAHRAAYDIEITAMLLDKLLGDYGLKTAENLINKKNNELKDKQGAQDKSFSKPSLKREKNENSINSIILQIIEEEQKNKENNTIQTIDFFSHEKLKDFTNSKISFALSYLAEKPENFPYIENKQKTQTIIQHLDVAIEKSWICSQTQGKLKPLYNYFSEQNISIDYSDLKIALFYHQNKSKNLKILNF